MFQCKCFSVLVDGSTRIREGEELKFLERQRGVLQKVFSRGKNLPIVMILMVPFTQLVKVRRGQLVLALPNIRFS